MAEISYGRVLTELALQDARRVAMHCDGRAVSRGDLDGEANRLARAFRAEGVVPGDTISLILHNGVPLIRGMLACWKLGAVPNPLSPGLPPRELAAILDRAQPRLVLGGESTTGMNLRFLPADYEPDPHADATPLPDLVAPHERVLATGGSTGLPKLIIPSAPAVYDSAKASAFFRPKRVGLVPGPIYHAAPFSAFFQALFAGCEVVLMPRFDALHLLELIEKHRVDRLTLVPTMMLRVMRLPESQRLSFDVSSLEAVISGGAPLPAWLMEAWIDWLGPDTMHELFGPSERIGGTHISGREWLEHRGSVGRPIPGCQMKILDGEGRPLPAGEMGEIWMIPQSGPGTTYRYVGAQSNVDSEGWESVGDMGSLDDDGYLYLGDRKSDMILSAGRNVYPAEIEAALEEFPSVYSSAVIGLPDEDLGQRIHAIIQTDESLSLAEVQDWLADRLIRYKHPTSIELVKTSLRDEAGKLRRSRLRDERLPKSSP